MIETQSDLIIRTVKLSRSCSPQQALDATGCEQYGDEDVIDRMLRAEGDEVDIVFFKPDFANRGGFISDDDLEKEFNLRGLKPADPISLIAVIGVDLTFMDHKPCATHWKDAKRGWCFVTFHCWRGKRKVCVAYRREYDDGWSGVWWFAGIRK